MDVFDGNTVFFEPRKATVSKTVTVGAQTDDVGIANIGIDPMPKITKSIQVDRLVEADTRTKEVHITEAVLAQVIKYLQANMKENSILKKLNALHAADKVAFLHKKQLELLQVEEFSVLGVESADCDIVAVSFGIRNHDSWCSHNAKVILIHGKQISYILLPCCPTNIRFGSRRALLIAGQNGLIYYTADGQIKSKVELHSLCITGLVFLSPQLLVSSSLDGYVSINLWDGFSLKQQHAIPVRVVDLPRRLRGLNHSDKTTGISSIACCEKTIFIGGETGAIWRIDYPALMIKYVATESDGIDEICLLDSYLIVATPFFQVKLYSMKGKFVTILSSDIINFRSMAAGLILLSNGQQIKVVSVIGS
uniref:WD_REPEATS_REGION domain-containing protein n=1 Tax=Syphacia muris TaxID=451379 RepID=A0A0N5AUI6_9BILA